MIIRPLTSEDSSWVSQVITNLWGSTRMVTRGKLVDLTNLEGFIAEEEGRKVGLITYVIARSEATKQSLECEIMSINSLTPGKGIGSLLLNEVEKAAKGKGCSQLIVITTNDNTNAVSFYKKNGFSVTAIRKDIMKEYRKLKPEIPLTGNNSIPITDEIEFHKAI